MKKHHHFTLVHFLLMLFITSLLITLLARNFEISQASIEEVSVNLSLLSMKQSMYYQNLISRSEDSKCKFLNNPDLFKQMSGDMNSDEQQIAGTWQYDSKKHQLIYNVRSKSYFRSIFEQKIVIELYCKEGMVVFKEKMYRWCHDKRVWGCKAW